ncbi:MAG: hypothetical protein IPM54_26935 [Polyangiaceae bacterium]|nr:hypothetical protein [Polyangiaceae bacterium]
MTTTAPGSQMVNSQRVKRLRASAGEVPFDDDPTEYPESEVMCREPVETEICLQLQPVLRRYLAERGIVAFVGSDNFIYWVKGDIKACVSPDLYVLPGIAPTSRPTKWAGTKDEQCWKTWIHQVVPSVAIEVKARHVPRKDELQSPSRHDALGTKELIVFDPFHHRRRSPRKRFAVYRRDAVGKLVIVLETNDDRVHSEQLDAFVVAQDKGDDALLRLAVGPNGEKLLPFESELVELETLRADEQTRLRQEAAQRANEEARRANEEARRANEEARRANEEARRVAELEAELARLRASMAERPKRGAKSKK